MQQRVLIIDDEKSLRRLLSTFLKDAGHRVTTAGNGKEAIEHFSTEAFDVVLIDIVLPDLSGIDLLERFQKARPETICIMFTGKPTMENAVASLRLGAFDYLEKPIERTKILQAVANAGMVKALRDEQSRLKAENRNYQNHLEQMVKEKTDALLKSEKRLRGLVETMQEGVMILNAEGCFTYVNPHLCSMTGYEADDLLDRSVTDLMDTENRRIYREEMAQLQKTRSGRHEITLTCKDGIPLYVLLSTSLRFSPDGRYEGCYSIITDLTERRLFINALSQSTTRSRQYERIVSASHDLLAFVDLNFTFLAANQAYADYVNQPIEKVPGMQVSDLFDPHLFENTIKPRLEQAFKGEKIVYQRHMVFPDGRKRFVDVAYYPYWDNRDVITGVVVSLRDITKLKEMEGQLRQAQKMEAMGTLAGGVAHDFNNILSAVIGYSELMIGDETLTPNNRESLEAILTAGKRARDLVQQILTFARRSEIERGPLAVHLIAKEALKMLRSSLPTTLEIRHHVYPASNVPADPTQIHQVIVNLCTNAAHAMGGKGRLTVSLENEMLDGDHGDVRHSLPNGPYVRLRVEDTGHGMSPEVVEKIFEPYFTTKEKGEGTGLGLATVHGIVQEMAGEILVESTPGKGTVFTLYFPAVPETKPEGAENRLADGGSETILFVDDETSIVRLNERRLESLGYETVGCTSSPDALARFKREPDRFDLVITDLTMPHMTGFALAEEIHKVRKDMPIILCTGFSGNLTQEQLNAHGVSEVLKKPLLTRELDEKIRAVLERRRP